MHLEISKAAPADAAWIADIWNAVIAETLVTFTTVPKTEQEVAEMIASAPVFVLEGQAGFATYGPFRSGPGYAATVEHSVYLAPDETGRGLGRALMQRLIAHAAEAGLREMVACISAANPGAVRFHSQLGFAEVGRMPGVGHKAGQWLDLIVMQKRLNPPDTAPQHR